MKDNFSLQSNHYSQYRPHYPKEVFDYLAAITPGHQSAWDVATGNGQVARGLVPHFKTIMATDISGQQIEKAFAAHNIQYSIAAAEHTPFNDSSFDLITIGQAIHWFNFNAFYQEAVRVGKHNAIIAAISYHLLRVDATVDSIIDHFYSGILHGYWDPERRYIDEYYRTIPFPFRELEAPTFQMSFEWNPDQLLGFLSSWSAVQHYRSRNGNDPVELIRKDLFKVWMKDETKTVLFPFFMRVGVIEK